MKLLTEELRAKLPKLYETENIPVEEKMAVVKFFQPWGSWTWYATEGSKVCPKHGNYDCIECPKPWNEFLFFGWVHGFEREWGYFSLKELESVCGPFGLKIEQDLYFKPTKIKDIGG